MIVLIKKVINKFLILSEISLIKTKEKKVYLTFDDGPEPGITEFVLNELEKYSMKATFFCKGSNAEKYPKLMRMILCNEHHVANHTYSHIKAYDISSEEYVKDVEKADEVLHTHIFRPPNGCLRFKAWLKLRKKYKIVYWTIGSGDWLKDNFNKEESMNVLKKTKSGDILLFHFSNDLQMGTRELLPEYLEWLNMNGYKSEVLPL